MAKYDKEKYTDLKRAINKEIALKKEKRLEYIKQWDRTDLKSVKDGLSSTIDSLQDYIHGMRRVIHIIEEFESVGI